MVMARSRSRWWICAGPLVTAMSATEPKVISRPCSGVAMGICFQQVCAVRKAFLTLDDQIDLFARVLEITGPRTVRRVLKKKRNQALEKERVGHSARAADSTKALTVKPRSRFVIPASAASFIQEIAGGG